MAPYKENLALGYEEVEKMPREMLLFGNVDCGWDRLYAWRGLYQICRNPLPQLASDICLRA